MRIAVRAAKADFRVGSHLQPDHIVRSQRYMSVATADIAGYHITIGLFTVRFGQGGMHMYIHPGIVNN